MHAQTDVVPQCCSPEHSRKGSVRRLGVMHVVQSLRTGGVELLVGQLARALSTTELEHTVCVIDAEGSIDPGVRVIELEGGYGRRLLLPSFLSVFRRERPDVVTSYNWGTIEAVIAARMANVPLVIHNEHGRNADTMLGEPWRQRILRRVAFRAAHRLVCVTQELKRHYGQQVGKVADRFEVIPNGVNTDLYRFDRAVRVAMRRQLGIGEDVIVFGAVGRLDRVKNHEALLHAAERVIRGGVQARVIIVGDGDRRVALSEIVAGSSALQGRVSLLGDRRDVPSLLNAFDIFVLPSLSEAMSLTLLEAMATALPVVVSAAGGNPEVVQHGVSGMVVDTAQNEALARTLIMLGRDERQRSYLGANALKRVERDFTFAAMLSSYARLYSAARRFPVDNSTRA